jgi:hypothetical protein
MDRLPFALVTLAAGVAYLAWHYVHKTTQPPRPPGPKGLPVIGNMRDMPTEYEWVAYKKLAKQYGKRYIPIDAIE